MACRWSRPVIRSDNGSGYISKEFQVVLKENGLGHQRIKPHCPEENGMIERANRTLREESGGGRTDEPAAGAGRDRRIMRWYNEERLHSALGYLPPVDYYRGDPKAKHEAAASENGRSPSPAAREEPGVAAKNIPYATEETVANP